MVTVTMRDEKLRPRGQLRCTKISMVIRKNLPHTFTLDISPEDIEKSRRVQKGWGMIFEEDGLRVSGPISSFNESSERGVSTRNLSGVSDLVTAKDRLTYPEPGSAAGAQQQSYYVYKGPAETAIKNLMRLNAGASALPERRTYGLSIAPDLGRGSGVSINTRLKNLLDEIKAAADASNLVISCAQSSNERGIVFDVTPARDLSRPIRLTVGADEVLGYETTQTHAEATTVIVGGQGEGADRNLQEVSAQTGWGGRRVEVFKDRRDTNNDSDLVKDAQAELADKGESIKLTFDVQESAARKFGKNFTVGDIITVELEHGATFVEQVTSATIEWSKNIRSVTLTVGNTDDDQVTSSEQKKLSALSTQLLHLQAI